MRHECLAEQKDICAAGDETNPFFRKSSNGEFLECCQDGNRNFIFPLSLNISKQVKIFPKNMFWFYFWTRVENIVNSKCTFMVCMNFYIVTYFHIYENICFSFKSVRFTKISFSWGYVKNRRRKDSLCKFRILNEIWSLILKRYLQNAFKDHKKLFLAVFLRSVNFSAAPVDSAFKLWRLKYDESDYSMINDKW